MLIAKTVNKWKYALKDACKEKLKHNYWIVLTTTDKMIFIWGQSTIDWHKKTRKIKYIQWNVLDMFTNLEMLLLASFFANLINLNF